MHDKKFNVRRRRGRRKGEAGEREEAGDGESGRGGVKVPEDRNDSI